jgi:hypothetical protein
MKSLASSYIEPGIWLFSMKSLASSCLCNLVPALVYLLPLCNAGLQVPIGNHMLDVPDTFPRHGRDSILLQPLCYRLPFVCMAVLTDDLQQHQTIHCVCLPCVWTLRYMVLKDCTLRLCAVLREYPAQMSLWDNKNDAMATYLPI